MAFCFLNFQRKTINSKWLFLYKLKHIIIYIVGSPTLYKGF
jgi:hypothetical protein